MTFTIEMNAEQMQALYDILGFVGGDASYSRRRYADDIRDALTDWVKDPHRSPEDIDKTKCGCIYFDSPRSFERKPVTVRRSRA